jgi:hypothetical protein
MLDLSRKEDCRGHGSGAGGAAGVEVGDSALLPSCETDRCAIGEEQAQRRTAHRASISRVGRRCAGLIPGYAHKQPECRRSGSSPGAHVSLFLEQLSQPARERGRIPTLLILEAPQELPGKLRVIAVLAKGILRVGSLGRPADTEPIVYISAGDFGRLGLDYESECVAECLTQNAPDEMVSYHPDTGTTSRPQYLQTRARARIRSAQ